MTEKCDLPPPNDADVRLWRAAANFNELCELAAKFVEGRIGYFPGWFTNQLYEETQGLRDVLAAINRRRFLTYMSQPGETLSPDPVNGKRAFVTGLMESWRADELRKLLEMTSLYVGVYGPNAPLSTRFTFSESPKILVNCNVSDEFYVEDSRYDILVAFEACLPKCSEAMSDIGGASFVAVVDLEWGRNNLFDQLAGALGEISDPIVENIPSSEESGISTI